MVGLSASELLPETLQAGEQIKHYPVAFVAGDPRAHRLATVLRIELQDHKFCIDIDTGDVIPSWMMIKRYPYSNGKRIEDSKWRKLRTFTFVTGSVDLPTHSELLKEGLAAVVPKAIAAVRARRTRELAKASGYTTTDEVVPDSCEESDSSDEECVFLSIRSDGEWIPAADSRVQPALRILSQAFHPATTKSHAISFT